MKHPIDTVRWVSRALLRPNDYNPNAQITETHRLLIESIRAHGWTQPIVVRPANEQGLYIIVDGEHRWLASQEVGLHNDVPIVILDTDHAGCIAATVRHNRARGSHGIEASLALVKQLRSEGLDDAAIEKAMGMSPEERARMEMTESAFLTMESGSDGLMSN